MDNDCNDYQGQNLHLVGEESSKNSSVLRPYALPKFDFDDSLQGHLRFDSLVENEVFLGIPSQEDNHWIEDFSRGSSGIEFRSSAAESCSIPRRNNVWSEATSSESVEMLLNSVGQEEMVPGESIIEESDACDELGSLAKQMELNLRQDEKIDDQDSNQASQAVELSGNISGLNQSSGGVDVDFKCTSETQEIEQSAFECSGANIEKSSLVLTKENLQADVKCDDENQQKPDTSVNESLNSRMQESSSLTEMQSNTKCSSQNMTKDIENLSNQEKGGAKHLESATDQPEEICEGVEKQSAQKNDSSVNVNDESLSRSLAEIRTSDYGSPLHVASKVEATQISEESSRFPERDGSALGDSQDLHSVSQTSQSSVVLVVPKNMEIKEHSTDKCEKSSGASQGDGGIDRHAVVSGEGESHGVNADFESQGSPLQTSHGQSSSVEMKEICMGSHSAMDRGASVTASEGYMSAVVCELHKQVNEASINHVDGIPSLTEASSSAEFVVQKHVIENPKENIDAAGVQEEAAVPSVPAWIQMSVENSSSDKIDVVNCDQDISICEKKDLRDVDSDSVELNSDAKRLSLSSLDEVKEKVELAHGLELGSPSMIESVSDAGNVTKVASHETSDNIPSVLVSGATADEVTDQNEEQNSPSDVVSIDIDKKEEMGAEVLSEANIPNLKEFSQLEGEPGPISEAEKIVPSDVALEVVIRADHTILAAETSDSANQGKGVIVDLETSKECSDEMQVDPVPCGSKLGEAEDAEAVAVEKHQDERAIVDLETSKECSVQMQLDPVPCGSKLGEAEDAGALAVEKHQETKIENNHGAEYSEVSGGGSLAETDKPSHDSACAVSYSELSKTEKREQECPMEAGIKNVTLAGSSDEVGGKGSDASREERSFTFDVKPLAGLSEGETCMGWQSFPNIKACQISMSEKGCALTSSSSQKDHEAVQEFSQTSSQVPEGGSPSGGPRSTSERKPRRGSAKVGKDNAKKGNNVKELTSVRQFEREDKLSVSVSPSGSVQLMQFEVGNTERSGTKPIAVGPISTSNLPDLNTSVPTSALFHQPFTDLQQVQLRAQIFVYGSLIQGAAPDEACMVSAFGTSDGGRSVWEPSWRACVERLNGQKSIANNHDTPVQCRSGSKSQDQSGKQSLPQSKVLPSVASRLSSKDTRSPAVNPMIPLSSPLWNISTPSCDGLPSSNVARGALLDYQALPLHPYQTPPMRTFGGHTTSWLSQAPFPGHWLASPQSSAIDFSARLSSLTTTETVKLTPVKDQSLAISSGTKLAFNNPVAQGGGSSTFAGTSPMLDGKKMTGSPVQHSADPKSRKRKKSNITKDPVQIPLAATLTGPVSSPVISSHSSKKGSAIEDLGPISLLARDQTELVSTPIIGSHFSTSIAVTAAPSSVPKSNSDKFLVAASPALSTDHSKRGDSIMEKSAIHAEDFSKVEEAKVQAEEAAADAASAVSHCQSLWTQLDNQRNSGFMSDVEAKLSSAAAAVAAAASVAKAAAAAAKIASSAALQAKQMADEALILSGTDIPAKSGAISISNVMNNFGSATSASILKGGDGNSGSNSIIFAAREAARRRVEAASAASRHAENLDAIVKAAELAAEAVSQAGVVVAMGEPLPMNVLVEAGPESYWKAHAVPSKQVVKVGTENGEKRNIQSFKEVPKQSKGPSDQEISTTNRGRPPLSRERSRNMEDNIRMEEGTSSSVVGGKKDVGGQKGRRASDLAKAITSIPESENGSVQDAHESEARMYNGIKEGCLVEVFKDGGHLKGAWYSANVLNLDDGKAFVCYTELQSNEGPGGPGLLREWVLLEGQGNEVPLIRIPHPMSSMRFEGTRKRRRAALRDYNWCVGDRVDAWIEDCWREGVITEKNKNDEATQTVHFPAQGETSVVKAWHLRPTLMWKDGEWIELPTSRENASSQGDTPQDKRQKRGSPAIVESGKDEAPKLLPLSSSEKVFKIGSNIDENKADVPRTMRSGLQKEGSKVIFGVPKPGKKRKFMDVSKHYVSEGSTKNSAPSNSVKFSKSMIPQGSGSRRWNHSSKIDTKEKQAAESKLKASKSGKLPGVPGRTLPQKENSSISSVSAPHQTTIRSLMVKDSIRNDKNESGRRNLIEFGSVSKSEEAVVVPISSQALPSDRTKKVSTNAKSEQLIKGKLAPAGGKSTKFEVKDKPMPEVIEPRRSNRRIQPTSRLLEGLQSSLIVSKIPSISHDKTQRSHNRVASRGTNNHG